MTLKTHRYFCGWDSRIELHRPAQQGKRMVKAGGCPAIKLIFLLYTCTSGLASKA